jgi:hypothetical protein
MYGVLESITLGFAWPEGGKGRTCRRATGEPPATLCVRSTISGESPCQLSFTTGKLETFRGADVKDSSELNESCRLGFDR